MNNSQRVQVEIEIVQAAFNLASAIEDITDDRRALDQREYTARERFKAECQDILKAIRNEAGRREQGK